MTAPTIKPSGFCRLHNSVECWPCRDAAQEFGPVGPPRTTCDPSRETCCDDGPCDRCPADLHAPVEGQEPLFGGEDE